MLSMALVEMHVLVFKRLLDCQFQQMLRAQVSLNAYLFRPANAVKYSDQCVCLCICLSVNWHNSKTRATELHQFLLMLPVAVARSSFDGVAMHMYFRFYG